MSGPIVNGVVGSIRNVDLHSAYGEFAFNGPRGPLPSPPKNLSKSELEAYKKLRDGRNGYKKYESALARYREAAKNGADIYSDTVTYGGQSFAVNGVAFNIPVMVMVGYSSKTGSGPNQNPSDASLLLDQFFGTLIQKIQTDEAFRNSEAVQTLLQAGGNGFTFYSLNVSGALSKEQNQRGISSLPGDPANGSGASPDKQQETMIDFGDLKLNTPAQKAEFLARVVHEFLHHTQTHGGAAFNANDPLATQLTPLTAADIERRDKAYGGSYALIEAVATNLGIPLADVQANKNGLLNSYVGQANEFRIKGVAKSVNDKLKRGDIISASDLKLLKDAKILKLKKVPKEVKDDPEKLAHWGEKQEDYVLTRSIETNLRNNNQEPWKNVGVIEYNPSDGVFDTLAEAVEDAIGFAGDILQEYGSDIGQVFGSALGNYIFKGENAKIVGSIVLGSIGEALGQSLENVLNGDSTGAAFGDAFADLPDSLLNGGVGAVSSYLTAELFDSLGIDGVAGELGQSLASSALAQLILHLPEIAAGSTSVGQALNGFNPANIIAGYVGSKLAASLVQFDTIGGQIGASIGSSLGGIIVAKAIADVLVKSSIRMISSLAGPIGIIAGTVLGYLVGGLIGSLFGGKPKSGADVQWDSTTGRFSVGAAWAKGGANKSGAENLASMVAGTLNLVLDATGSTLLGGEKVRAGGYGTLKSKLVYRSNEGGSSRDVFSTADANVLTTYGVYTALQDVVGGLAGGDVFLKRALVGTLAQTSNPLAGSNTFSTDILLGNITTAQDYSQYIDNRNAIGALVASSPDSAFTAGWAITLKHAEELGLTKRAFTDWIGGWSLYLDTTLDGVADGLAFTPSNMTHALDTNTKERLFVLIGEEGEVLDIYGDTIDTASKSRVTGSGSADNITIVGDVVTATSGLTIDGAAPATSTFKIPVAALIDAGAGDDVIRAGDLGNDVLGGAGNDKIVGGKLDDWLFGEDGDDTLFAGDVVSAGVVTQAALQAGGAVVVDPTAATSVNGGNGDLLDGGAGNDRLYGGTGSDWLKGGDGVDVLVGGAGGDILEGGRGDDQQAGGVAAILGGAGSDQYVFGYGDGNDVLFDESDPAGVAGSTGDSFYNRVTQLNAGALTRNWAGNGNYEVDGSVKGGEDAVVFGVGVTMRNLIIKRSGANGQDLVIQLTADDPAGTLVNGQVVQVLTGDSLTIKDWFESTRKVEWLRFVNGDEIRIGDITSYIVGVAGQSVIVGTYGADWIVGTDDNDKIYGLNGDDFGFGGLGADLVSGDANNDLVSGGGGDDIVVGGAGNDTVFGDGGRDSLSGGAGWDILAGGKGDDTIVAGGGDDVIRYSRGDGRDILIDDLVDNWDLVWQDGYYVNGYSVGPNGTIVKTTGNIQDTITTVYFDGSNWINGADYDYDATTRILRRHKGAVNGVISNDVALGGSDTLEFGVGIDIQDLLLRKVGNDLEITISDVDATSGFAGGDDRILIRDWWSATGVELRPIEKFSFLATGTTVMANYTIGITAMNGSGWTGAATDGDDAFQGASGRLWATGGGGADTMAGGALDDILSGGGGSDVLQGGDGDDVLYGGAGDDQLRGGLGADRLFGGTGQDTVEYASGTLFGGGALSQRVYLGAAWANGGQAIGDVYDSIENVSGGSIADRLGGDEHDNELTGQGGVDELFGGAGDDTYIVNAGGSSLAQIHEGVLSVEQILDVAGNLQTGFAASWQLMRYAPVNGTNVYQYLLTVRRDADGLVVYASRDGQDFNSAVPLAQAPSAVPWPGANGQWTGGATASGNGRQVTVEHILAGDGGDDTISVSDNTVTLSRMTFSRDGTNLSLRIDDVERARMIDQTVAGRGVEHLALVDGLVVDLANLRVQGEATTGGADLVLRGAAADVVDGQAGDDVLSGGAGIDTLLGGDGDDTLEGGAGADVLDGGGDSQTAGLEIDPAHPDSYGDTARYLSSQGAVIVNLATGGLSGGDAEGDTIARVNNVSTIENVTGSYFYSDQLTGDARDNRLFGYGGDDVLDGGAGDDVLVGGTGVDILYGGDGDDALTGEDGADRLDGGAGADFLSGGAGADVLLGGAGIDQLSGDDADDLLYGGDDADILGGGLGVDKLYGEAGNDQLAGGDGADLLYGGTGDDTLLGETGDDQLDGGLGNDTYGFDANSGSDRVIDASGSNRLVINGVTADQIWLTRVGDDLRIALIGGSSIITVAGYYAATGASLVKEIALQGGSLFLAHAQDLISAMTAWSAGPPAAAPAAIAALAAPLWQIDSTPAPTVSNQTFTIDEDTPLSGQVLASDFDDNITGYALLGQPPKGYAQVHPTTGAWTYTPTANANGADSFVIVVTDANGQTAQQTVSVTVRPVADAPTLGGPTSLTLSEATVPGSVVAAFTSTDADVGEVGTFTLDNDAGGRFAISSSGQLTLKAGATLNYETATSHLIRVRVSDVTGLFTTRDITVTVADVNEAPTGINATGLTIAENKAADVLVATLTGVDPDGAVADPLTLTLTNDAGGRFKIVGNQLRTTATMLNYEAATSHVVTVLATDRGGLTFSKSFTVTVTNVNEAPTAITTSNLSPIAENSAGGLLVANFSSTDPDAGDTRTFSLANNPGGRFAISTAGVLTVQAGAVLDYEATSSISITVKVTDAGGLSYQKAFSVVLTNVPEAPNAPAVLTSPNVLVSENAALGGLTVATFSLTDPDLTTPVLQLSSDAQNWLEVVPGTGTVRFKAGLVLDFETLANAGWTLSDTDADGAREAVYTAKVLANDGALSSPTTDLVIRVEDVNEAPTGLTLTPTGATVYERDRIDTQDANAAPAIKLGTLAGVDPDLASSGLFHALTYSTADSRFSINGAELWLNAGAMASLDFETSTTFSVAVVVTDGGGLSFTQTLTFSLTNRDDFLRGTNSDEFLNGQSGTDQLFGNGGNDILTGNAGNDSLWGGIGDDTLNGNAGADLLNGEDGNDILYGGDNADTLNGGAGADQLFGNASGDVMNGGDGDDLLVGGSGADQMTGGLGYDTLSYAGSATGVSINLATKAVSGGDAAGDIIVDAFEKLVGSDVNDVLVGTTAVETIDGGAGADQITGGGGQDLLYGGAGDDIINGDADNDTIYGDDGNDTLTGGAGADKLYGGAGNDWLYAGGGGDVLDGGTGDDYLDGDIGSDDYIVSATSGNDRIHDYDPDGTDKDTINFVGLTHNQLWLQRMGDDLKITVLDKNTSVTVEGWFTPPPAGSPANSQIEVLITDPKVTLQANTLLALMDAKRPGNSTTLTTPPAGFGPPTQADMTGYLTDSTFASNWADLWKINQAPTLNPIGALSTSEDVTKTVLISAHDDYSSDDKLHYALEVYSDAAMTQAVAGAMKAWSVTGVGAAQTLSLTPGDNLSGLFYVRLRAFDMTNKTDDTASVKSFQLNVLPVADAPNLSAMGTILGTLDSGSMSLGDIPAALKDIDGSESLEVVITGLDPSLNLNKGQRQADQSWKLTGAQLTGLVLTGASTWAQDQNLVVTAYAREGATGEVASTSKTWTLAINARPTGLSSGAISVAETTAESQVVNGTVLSTFTRTDADGPGDTPIYSLIAAGDGKAAGADGRFAINSATGALTLANNTLLNYEAATSHLIRVLVTDTGGLTYSQNFTVNVTDVNERPTVGGWVNASTMGTVSELAGAGTVIGTVSFSDPDILTAANVNLRFSLSGTGSEKFSISNSGVVTYLSGSIDYETQPHAYNLTVTVKDQGGSGLAATSAITINVTDVNDAPTIGNWTSPGTMGAVSELASAGTYLGTVSFNDADTNPANVNLVFSLSGTGSEKFSVNAAGQVFYQAGNIDYETQPHAYNLTVTVKDQGGAGYSASSPITVNVTDVNERPTIGGWTSPGTTGVISELVAAGTYLGTVSFSDPDIQTPANVNLVFSLSGTGSEKFSVNGLGQVFYQTGSIDYETQAHAYNLTVTVKDQGGAGLAASSAVTINVADANESPTIGGWTSPGTMGVVSELAGAGTYLGTVSFSDPDIQTPANVNLVFSLSGTGSEKFSVNAAGQVFYQAGNIDYETQPHAYNLTVTVKDQGGAGYSASSAVTINVADANDRPTIGGWTNPATMGVISELVAPGTYMGTVQYGDADTNPANVNLVFSLSGTGSEKFSVNGAGQVFYQGGSIDYETQPHAYNLTVTAKDQGGAGLAASSAITINVADANETPWVGGWSNPGVMGTVSELAGPATYVGTVTYGDPDTQTPANVNLVFSLSGTGSEKFSINTSGQIYYQQGNIDYETQPHAYNLTVTARDQGGAGLAANSSVTINVSNVDEPPSLNWAFENHGGGGYFNPQTNMGYSAYRELMLYPSDPGGNPTTLSIVSYTGGPYPPTINYYNGVASIVTLRAQGIGSGTYIYTGNVTIRVSSIGGSVDYTFAVDTASATRIAPIVFDLDGNGVSLVASANSAVWFDQDGDGSRDRTGWVGAGDGLLVLDRNRNGQIDDGSEIRFSTDVAGATSDLEGLRAYDSNANGFFDQNDARFSEFQIWQDANGDAVSQAGELKSLTELGVTAINLTLTRNPAEDQNSAENYLYGTTQFVRADGTTGEVGDVMFAYQGAPEITLVSTTDSSSASGLLPPVVIDLDGDGVELVSRAASTVRFDVAGNGQAVRTGWVGADDAFLALDRDGDGKIASGAEISFTNDLAGAVSDLEGLQAFDSNANGFLDAEDARFGEFKVWQDRNQDGVSQADELHGLGELGLRALNLTRTLTGATLASTGENVLYATSDLVKTDGSRLAVGDVMLAFGGESGSTVELRDDGTSGGRRDRPDPFKGRAGPPDLALETAPEAASDGSSATSLSNGLDTVDRTAASTAKPRKSSKPAADGDPDQAIRPNVDPLPASAADEGLPAALAPKSWSQIDLAGILDAARTMPSGLAAIDYDAMVAGPSPSALDANLALAQQTRLRMIQAMAGFSREGAADLGPDAWRQGHAQSLALLTALPDVRGR